MNRGWCTVRPFSLDYGTWNGLDSWIDRGYLLWRWRVDNEWESVALPYIMCQMILCNMPKSMMEDMLIARREQIRMMDGRKGSMHWSRAFLAVETGRFSMINLEVVANVVVIWMQKQCLEYMMDSHEWRPENSSNQCLQLLL